jgi:hypothetical protein
MNGIFESKHPGNEQRLAAFAPRETPARALRAEEAF